MQRGVVRNLEDLQVLNTVVGLDGIFMVDLFVGGEFPTETLLHNKAMLKYVSASLFTSSGIEHKNISFVIDTSAAFEIRVFIT